MSDEPAVYGAVNVDPWGTKRIGDWIQTRTGRKFHLLDPRPEDFCIEDIAHALANQCRFTGHVSQFYSVAEHSVRACELVLSWTANERKHGYSLGNRVPFEALMHDATEAYMCDMARPFKQLPEFLFYRELEDKLMAEIADAFDITYPFSPQIKKADEIMLGTEARDLMAPVRDGWHFRYEHLQKRIKPWSPSKAKRRFLDLFYKLNPLGIRKPRFWFIRRFFI